MHCPSTRVVHTKPSSLNARLRAYRLPQATGVGVQRRVGRPAPIVADLEVATPIERGFKSYPWPWTVPKSRSHREPARVTARVAAPAANSSGPSVPVPTPSPVQIAVQAAPTLPELSPKCPGLARPSRARPPAAERGPPSTRRGPPSHASTLGRPARGWLVTPACTHHCHYDAGALPTGSSAASPRPGVSCRNRLSA